VSVGANIHVTFEIAPGLPRAVADLNQLEMAILNLAINARDAMADGGNLQIIVSLRDAADGILTSGTYVVIAVKDSGSGIPQEILGKVFDPFFTTKPVDKGTGLGLSQVYGIANQSGGLARIDSTVGKGTTVEVWLPVASVEAVPAPDPQSQEPQLPLKESGNILVIEDDNEVRQFIVESLEILGYAVQHAENGWFGLEKLQHENFDLMIVDFLMPGMNGAEVIAACANAIRICRSSWQPVMPTCRRWKKSSDWMRCCASHSRFPIWPAASNAPSMPIIPAMANLRPHTEPHLPQQRVQRRAAGGCMVGGCSACASNGAQLVSSTLPILTSGSTAAPAPVPPAPLRHQP